MAYSDPASKSHGQTFNLSDYNCFRDNWLASAVKTVAAKGDLVAGTAPNALSRLALGDNTAVLTVNTATATGLEWRIQPAARVYPSGGTSLSAGVWTPVECDVQRFVRHTMHSTTVNNTRLTVPSGGAGVYAFGGCVEFGTSGLTGQGGFYGLGVRKNGSAHLVSDFREQAIAGYNIHLSVSTIIDMGETDYVELVAYTTRADVNLNASAEFTDFWGAWLRT